MFVNVYFSKFLIRLTLVVSSNLKFSTLNDFFLQNVCENGVFFVYNIGMLLKYKGNAMFFSTAKSWLTTGSTAFSEGIMRLFVIF